MQPSLNQVRHKVVLYRQRIVGINVEKGGLAAMVMAQKVFSKTIKRMKNGDKK